MLRIHPQPVPTFSVMPTNIWVSGIVLVERDRNTSTVLDIPHLFMVPLGINLAVVLPIKKRQFPISMIEKSSRRETWYFLKEEKKMERSDMWE
jgi:hypothetical protein